MTFPRPSTAHGSAVDVDRSLAPFRRAGFALVTFVAAVLAGLQVTNPAAVAPRHLTTVGVPAGPSPGGADSKPFHAESWISPAEHTPTVHCSTLSNLPNGDLLAVWYGGAREGAGDVAVFTSRLNGTDAAWAPPSRAVDRDIAEVELGRPIKKVGNAVVFPDRFGHLWMVYVSVTLGGWSGCTLNVKTSTDQGKSWGPSHRLNLNPFLNLSTLVRSKPIHTTDGRIGLPVYHEMALKYPQILWLTPGDDGSLLSYQLRSLPRKDDLIQPTLVPLGDDRVLMVLRDGGPERVLHTAFSNDNGWTWSAPVHSNLPNPDSAVDALRLRDGRVLLVYNDALQGRDTLRLAVSNDGGVSWRPGPVLEHEARKEFSYPSMTEGANGRIHVTYTWQRKRIKHVEFNVAWLDQSSVHRTASLQ